MDLGLKGKVAWITGASRGIGLAVARRLGEEGCRVVLCARTEAPLEKARRVLEKRFGKARVLALTGDAADPVAAAGMAAAVKRRFGRLDILVANVGTGRIPGGDSPSDADWEHAVAQNLRSAFQAARQAMPLLEASGSGRIVVIGSIAGVEDFGAPVAYAAVKAALHAWATVLGRQAVRRGVRVNTLLPGNILFPGGVWDAKLREDRQKIEAYIRHAVPMGRFGTPEEVADAAAFLASDRAAFITGARLVVDGGQTRSLS